MIPSQEVQELIRYTAYTYFNRKKYGIRKTVLMKILFKTKTALSENNSLKKQFPYYWYKFGPHSEIVEDYNDYMINEKFLKINMKNEIIATHKKIAEHDDNFNEAAKIILQEIESAVSNSAESEMYDTYVKFAPVKFYESFRYDFLRELTKYSKNVSDIKVDNLILMLYKTMGDLPNHSLFSDFKYAYFDFIKIMEEILQQKKIHLDMIVELSKNIDDVFAYGMRVKFYDEPYEKDIENWKLVFEKNVKTMREKINELYVKKSSEFSAINNMKFNEFVEEAVRLKENHELKEIIFLSSKRDEDIGNIIDEEVIDKMNIEQFNEILSKYNHSQKAILSYSKNNKNNRIDCNILT